MRRTIPEHLLIQSLAYISAGIFLAISHYLYEYLPIRYFGYILLSISIILLFSLIIFEFSQITWFSNKTRLSLRHFTRRIAITLDNLFIRILPMLAIAALIFTSINEIVYVNKLKEQNNPISVLEEANLGVVLAIVAFGLLLYIIAQMVPIFIRRWRFGIFVIPIFIIFIILNSLKVPNLYVVFFLLAIIAIFVLLSFRRNVRRRVWRDLNQAAPRIFFLISIVLLLAGIPAAFSKIFSLNDFWGKGLCFACLSVAFELRLPIWINNFTLSVRVIFKFCLLFLLAGILYIWVVAFDSDILWALFTWLICFVVSLSPEYSNNLRISV